MSTNNQSSMAQRIISTTASSNLLDIDSLNSKNCGKKCVDSNSFSGFKHPDCNTFFSIIRLNCLTILRIMFTRNEKQSNASYKPLMVVSFFTFIIVNDLLFMKKLRILHYD